MRTLNKTDLDKDPNLLWNEFINMLAMEDFSVNQTEIKEVSLVFWHDSELQNGGHLQYFENRGIGESDSTIQALAKIGAAKQKKIFEKALKIWRSKVRKPIVEIEAYVVEALSGEFEKLDSEYYDCTPDINSYLQEYINKNKNEIFNII